MPKIGALIKLAYETAYDLQDRKQYSDPKIFDWGGDLSKRWYVYFSFRNPATGRLVRQPYIDTGINQHKNLRDRRKAANNLRLAITSVLEQGLYNPFTDIHDVPIEEARKLNIPQAIEFVLAIKKNQYKTGFPDLASRLNQFRDWLLDNGFRDRLISAVTRVAVINYLNFVLEKTSPRNRNNTRIALSTFFTVLRDNEIVPTNLVEGINVLKAEPKRHKSYTDAQLDDTLAFMRENLPTLLLYIQFVIYGFVRGIEVNRLRVKDVDPKGKRIYFRAKNKNVKTKIIPDILLEQLPDLSKLDPDSFLFGYDGIGQFWQATEMNRRGRYTNLFKIVKDHFKLGIDYGVYSYRHTFITRLYYALLKKHGSPNAAKSELMLITGHKTMQALEMYLRDIDAEFPEDYSHLLR